MTSDVDLTNHPDPAALRPAAMWLRYDSRADGWTPGRRAAFVTHLADNGVVAEAAAAVGKSLASAYALRRRAGGYSFNLGWEAALLLARRRVADELMAAAIKGETAVWTREEGKTTYTLSTRAPLWPCSTVSIPRPRSMRYSPSPSILIGFAISSTPVLISGRCSIHVLMKVILTPATGCASAFNSLTNPPILKVRISKIGWSLMTRMCRRLSINQCAWERADIWGNALRAP